MIPAAGQVLFKRHSRALGNKSWAVLHKYFFSSKTDVGISEAFLHVIGTGGNEISPTLCLASGKYRYWFNCAEGTTRTIGYFRLGLGSIPSMLFTRKSWDNMAGFSNLYFRYDKLSNFNDAFPCMAPGKSKEAMFEMLTHLCGRSSVKDIDEVDDGVFTISRINLDSEFAAYYCKQYGKNGTLDAQKAISLGVPVGKQMTLLKEGKDYTTSSGRIVQSDQVVGPKQNGASFVILQCLNENYIDSICDHKQLQASELNNEKDRLDFMVHMTPLDVINNEKYCAWMSSLGSNVYHILLHSSVCPGEISWRDSFGFSLPFHMMNPEVFQIPSIPKKNDISWSSLNLCKYLKPEQVVIGQSRLKVHIAVGQNVKIDFSKTLVPLDTYVDDVYDKVMKYCHTDITSYHQKFPEVAKNSIDHVNRPYSPKLLHHSDAVVTFLGTSGSENSIYRNETSILLQSAHGGNILLDCGEGTFIQLKKCFGEKEAIDILSQIHVVFISHMHPDHWNGLFELLRQKRMACDNSLVTVVAPPSMPMLMKKYCAFLSDIDCDLINSLVIEGRPYVWSDWSLKVIPVHHISHSYGVKISKGNEWCMVYSGDTRPCPKLLEEGKNASLLIHEGTFSGDRNYSDIALERHCLYSEAVRASKECNADFTAITHFSNAETLFPLTEPNEPSIVPAVDFMSLKLSDIARHHLDSHEASRIYQSVCVYSKSLRDESMSDIICDSSLRQP